MAEANIETPTLEEILEKMANDLKTKSPESNPFDPNSLLRAELIAFSGRVFSAYQVFQEVVKQTFDATATGLFLELRGAELRITRNPATQSTGDVSFQGILGTIIPLDSELSDTSGNLFKTTTAGGVDELAKAVTLTPLNGTVTAVFSEDHLMGNDFEITISGATETDLNGTFNCQVVNATTISYQITNQTASSADSGTCTYLVASVPVKSVDFGDGTNKVGGDIVSLTTPIAGINTDGVVQQSGIGGGANTETDEELRERIIFRRQNPTTNWNTNAIKNEVLTLTFVDRVFVDRITPEIGQATTYCMKDDLTVLNATELAQVKDKVVAISPVNTAIENIFVLNPTQISTVFTFDEIVPDTATMRQAVYDNLQALFNEADISTDITQEQYNRAILNTIDPATFERLTSYDLASPTTDITIADGEIATFGGIVWN